MFVVCCSLLLGLRLLCGDWDVLFVVCCFFVIRCSPLVVVDRGCFCLLLFVVVCWLLLVCCSLVVVFFVVRCCCWQFVVV